MRELALYKNCIIIIITSSAESTVDDEPLLCL